MSARTRDAKGRIIDHMRSILEGIGGLGLLLLGMIVMTEGLRELAGDTIRSWLARFTRSPWSGAATGALGTAVLQSSSATTVAAVGFVSAGLLTYPQALGIVFGATLGTTFTGWMVALVGFKWSLGSVLLPLVLIGAVLRLFARNGVASLGFAVAGFGLMFVGIDLMQEGLGGLQDVMTPDRLPGDTLPGRLALVAIGVLITVLTQSSSAGVATAVTAVHTGAIHFEQAAAMVIGMNVGTTITAVFAAIGGSAGARRTGFSHAVYNVVTSTGAFFLISPYVWMWDVIAPRALPEQAEIGLVAFHTLFNALGLVLIVPYAAPFGRMMERLVPDRGPVYAGELDEALLEDRTLALDAVHGAVGDLMDALIRHVGFALGDETRGKRADLPRLEEALDKAHAFLDRVHVAGGEDPKWERLVHLVHALDHMQRLGERCEETERIETARTAAGLREHRDAFVESLWDILDHFEHNRWHDATKTAKALTERIHEQVRPMRADVMERIARGDEAVASGTELLEAIRWMRRVSKHVARIAEHYAQASLAAGE